MGRAAVARAVHPAQIGSGVSGPSPALTARRLEVCICSLHTTYYTILGGSICKKDGPTNHLLH